MKKRGYEVFEISAATKFNVDKLLKYTSGLLDTIPMPILAEDDSDEEKIIKFEEDEPFTVRRENDTFIVEGEWVKRLIGSTNFADNESLQYFQRSLRKKGVIKALEAKGINEGNPVKIYDIEFDYVR